MLHICLILLVIEDDANNWWILIIMWSVQHKFPWFFFLYIQLNFKILHLLFHGLLIQRISNNIEMKLVNVWTWGLDHKKLTEAWTSCGHINSCWMVFGCIHGGDTFLWVSIPHSWAKHGTLSGTIAMYFSMHVSLGSSFGDIMGSRKQGN